MGNDISVIITTYNYGRYLEGAIDSVLNQTLLPREVIVINDGSTDNTDKLMSKYTNNPLIKYIAKKNEGQTKTKNLGIREAKGDFVAFLDADDVWMPRKLEKQMVLFSDSKVGVVYSGFIQINDKGEVLKEFRNLPMHKGKVTENLYMDNFVCFPSSVVRRECFSEMGGFDESLKMGIDWDLWLRFSTKYLFDFVSEPLVKYRVGHLGQMSHNKVLRQKCSDQIMIKFNKLYPRAISKSVYQRAWAFTYRNRFKYYAAQDGFLKAFHYWVKAVMLSAFDVRNLIVLWKTLVNRKSEG